MTFGGNTTPKRFGAGGHTDKRKEPWRCDCRAGKGKVLHSGYISKCGVCRKERPSA